MKVKVWERVCVKERKRERDRERESERRVAWRAGYVFFFVRGRRFKMREEKEVRLG